MTVRVLFHSNQYSERGDSTNARSYAVALQESLSIESILAYPRDNPGNNPVVISELRNEGLQVVPYGTPDELSAIARSEGITHSYFMNNGSYSPLWIPDTQHLTHAVFRSFEPHGDRYCYCSEWLYDFVRSPEERARRRMRGLRARARGRNRQAEIRIARERSGSPFGVNPRMKISWVPHCVYAQAGDGDAFRRSFGIPIGVPLVGRIGGRDQFDDPAAQAAVSRLLAEDPTIHFIFVNTDRFLTHDRVTHVGYVSDAQKWDFYAAGDVFLNGRLMGESFGFSIIEPLSVGKPVIAPAHVRNRRMDRHHEVLLRGLDLLYESADDLVRITRTQLNEPAPAAALGGRVKQFAPPAVAERFQSEFLL